LEVFVKQSKMLNVIPHLGLYKEKANSVQDGATCLPTELPPYGDDDVG